MSATHIVKSFNDASPDVPLYVIPAIIRKSVIGRIKNGIQVQVTREWVNKKWNEIKIVDQSEEMKAFQATGIKEQFFFISRDDLEPLPQTPILPKIYVVPQMMNKLERVLIPDWTKNIGKPFFHKGDAEYWIAVKLPYTQCVGGPEQLKQKGQEAKMLATEALFRYYNVKYNQTTKEEIGTFVNGFLSCHVHDYHMDARPSSKLKMLVKVRAMYFQWQRINNGQLKSTKLQDLPNSAKKILLDPEKFENEMDKMAKYMAKLSMDMYRENVLVPGVNLMREGRRLKYFISTFKNFLKENGIEAAMRSRRKFYIEMGLSATNQIEYVAVKFSNKGKRRQIK